MLSRIKNFLKLLFTRTSKEATTEKLNKTLVAAGNPALPFPLWSSDSLQSVENQQQMQGMQRFIVCGSSMSPCGIANGDLLFTEKLGENLHRNDFIVVSVDQKAYDTPIKFAYKLRRYLMDVSEKEDRKEVIERLKLFHKEILEREFQQRLTKKFEKTKRLYPNDNLCLSITFRNGDLRYSFHPRNFVEFKVKFFISAQSHEVIDVSTIEAY